MTLRPFYGDDGAALLTEFNHRLCNTFQILAGQVARCGRETECEIVKPLLGQLDGRLRSLAAMHRLLAAPDPLLPLEDHCRRLSLYLVQAFDRTDVTPWVCMEDLLLGEDREAKIALIVVELVTNVMKHSFIDDLGGTIWIDLKLINGGAEVTVSDSSKGPVHSTAPSTIVAELARSLTGRAFVTDRNGYTAGVWFPMDPSPATYLRQASPR